jgi:TorA maturation chaperone TorD
MQACDSGREVVALDLAREYLYRFLAMALSDPTEETSNYLSDPAIRRLTMDAAELLRQEAEATPTKLGLGELPPNHLDVLPLLAEFPEWSVERVAAYQNVFGLVCNRECPPYETEYQPSSESFFRAQQLADIAGFYRAFGIEPAAARPERPDYLPLELEFMAFLLMKKRLAGAATDNEKLAAEHVGVCERAERTFFQEHLVWWAASFAQGLRRKTERGWYARCAELLAAFLPIERSRLGVSPPRMPLQPALIERPEEQTSCAECVAS